jgi:hypothetical protein
LAFGIPLQAITYPDKTSFSIETIDQILNNAYWPIYGEMKVLENLGLNNCNKTFYECFSDVKNVSKISCSILLMVYMVIANVLLLNLLIAMFR